MQRWILRHNVSQAGTEWFFNPLKESENGDEKILTQSQVWTGGIEDGRERDAAAQKGNSQIGQRPEGEESQAGHRDRTLGSPEKGSQGSKKKDGKEGLGIKTLRYRKQRSQPIAG